MDIKPGWKTSEFWITLVPIAMSMLVMFDVLSQDDADKWSALIVPGIVMIVAQFSYTRSRGNVKSSNG